MDFIPSLAPVPFEILFQLRQLRIQFGEDARREAFLKYQKGALFKLLAFQIDTIESTRHVLFAPFPMLQQICLC